MLLELKNIKKYFPVTKGFLRPKSDYVRAVDDVSLTIKEGECLGLVGESGCGKTTLGRIILKLYPVDSGQIIFGEKNITRFSPSRMRPLRRDIQMVFQDPYNSLDPRFNIRNVILEAMVFDAARDRDQKEERVRELLSLARLPGDVLYRFPHEFSGGERQRIAIARALAGNPKLLILDEAVSSLDVLVQDQIVGLLQDLQKKMSLTYLFISHNLRVVKKISSRIAVMYKGKIIESAAATQIFAGPLHPYTQELLSAAMEYKTSGRSGDFEIHDNSQLIDKGEGHFVIQ